MDEEEGEKEEEETQATDKSLTVFITPAISLSTPSAAVNHRF